MSGSQDLPQTISVGIVHPQEFTQYGLNGVISSNPKMRVVGVADDCHVGIDMILERRPMVALVNIDLPTASGFELAERLKRQFQTKIVLCSRSMPDVYIAQALRANVAGYLLLTEELPNIVNCVSRVAAGGRYYSPEVLSRLRTDSNGSVKAAFEGSLFKLSPRQFEVLRNLAIGMTVKDVADRMHISAKSVDSQKYRLMQSLNIHDRVDLARFAVREGVVSAS